MGTQNAQAHVIAKGKRGKKRKRKQKPAPSGPELDHLGTDTVTPDYRNHWTLGYNETTRYLECLAQRSVPKLGANPTSDALKDTPMRSIPQDLTAIFVPRFDQPSILSSDLPFLVNSVSAVSSSPQPRLISLPKGSAERLGAALSIPRAGLIGLKTGAPNAESLVELIRQSVPEVEIPWFQASATATYLAVNWKTVQTSINVLPDHINRGGEKEVVSAAENKDE